MKIELLLLAAQVRENAKVLRSKAATKQKSIDELHLTPADRVPYSEYLERFAMSHPVEEFIPAAIKELEDTASLIEQHFKPRPE